MFPGNVAALAAIRGYWQITDVPGLSPAPSYRAAPIGALFGTGAAAWGCALLWGRELRVGEAMVATPRGPARRRPATSRR